MKLFPHALIGDLRALSGVEHSFLKHLADDTGAPLRESLERVAERVGPPIAARWAEVLNSLDNRRFFQGFAEATTADLLLRAGWQVQDLAWPGPCLVAREPGGTSVNVVVLAFIQQVRPVDKATKDRLAQALERTGSRTRIGVLVQRWLPHEFDPEPIRRAVELWLREVDRGDWQGRHASYEDDDITLEFALTGETASDRQGVVAFLIGPFFAQRTLEALERRIVYELDTHSMGTWSEMPLLVSAVTDQTWGLPRGYIRELLYGKPARQVSRTDIGLELAYGADSSACLFRDPQYRMVSGLLLADRDIGDPTAFNSRAYQNPWAQLVLPPDALPMPALSARRWEAEGPVLGWFTPDD